MSFPKIPIAHGKGVCEFESVAMSRVDIIFLARSACFPRPMHLVEPVTDRQACGGGVDDDYFQDPTRTRRMGLCEAHEPSPTPSAGVLVRMLAYDLKLLGTK